MGWRAVQQSAADRCFRQTRLRWSIASCRSKIPQMSFQTHPKRLQSDSNNRGCMQVEISWLTQRLVCLCAKNCIHFNPVSAVMLQTKQQVGITYLESVLFIGFFIVVTHSIPSLRYHGRSTINHWKHRPVFDALGQINDGWPERWQPLVWILLSLFRCWSIYR